MSSFELWEYTSGNLIDVFPSEAEALQMVRDLLATGDVAYRDCLGLSELRADGTYGPLLDGEELARAAEGAPASRREKTVA